MAHAALSNVDPQYRFAEASAGNEAKFSAVSWAAVIAGAFVAAALSLILLALGTGIGLSSVSPWSNTGASAPAFSRGAVIWLIAMQILAFTLGGYLAGRLRTKWVNVHMDEVYFRDTAHGFLVWAVGLVITAAFLVPAATSMVGGPGAARTAEGTQAEGRSLAPNEYFVDSLFRSDRPNPESYDAQVRAEVGIILAAALRQGTLPRGDQTYLAELVAAKTGLSQSDAEKRVSQVFEDAQQTADTVRKAVAHSLYWLFLALLMGAFCASYAATIGGRQRDHIPIV